MFALTDEGRRLAEGRALSGALHVPAAILSAI